MAKHGLKCWKLLEVAKNGWKWLELGEITGMTETSGYCWKWLKIAGMAGNGWTWLYMTGTCWKWLK